MEAHMIGSVLYACFALFIPCPILSPADQPILPATAIAGTAREEGQSGANRTQAVDSTETRSCRKFVGDFYTWYIAHSKSGDPLRTALKRYKSNFSAELVQRLNEDRRAAAKSPGEIVGLDFDPVLNSQDTPEKYVPGAVTQNGRRFLVEVFSFYSGKKSAAPAVTPELLHEHGRWVFSNFRYKSDGKSDDLLSILAHLKTDRKKGK